MISVLCTVQLYIHASRHEKQNPPIYGGGDVNKSLVANDDLGPTIQRN